jgi:hypothetical protein
VFDGCAAGAVYICCICGGIAGCGAAEGGRGVWYLAALAGAAGTGVGVDVSRFAGAAMGAFAEDEAGGIGVGVGAGWGVAAGVPLR